MKPIHAIAPIILGVFLSGCAALEVQVDVYKGPLTNDEDIQLKQAASITMAAKPLLEQLRYEAECDYQRQHRNDPALKQKAVKQEANMISCNGGHNQKSPDFNSESPKFLTWQGQHANTLLKDYQDMEWQLDQLFHNTDPENNKPDKILRTQMVYFAEKLRVMGNTDFLFTANGNNPSHWIATDSEVLPTYHASKTISKYASLLQTIGNGLITLMDDWQKNHDYKKELKGDLLKVQQQARTEAKKMLLQAGLKQIQENIKADNPGDAGTLLTKLDGSVSSLEVAVTDAKTLRDKRKSALDTAPDLKRGLDDSKVWEVKNGGNKKIALADIRGRINSNLHNAFDKLAGAHCSGGERTLERWRTCLCNAANEEAKTKQAAFDRSDLWHSQLEGLLAKSNAVDTLAVDIPSPKNAKDIYDVVSNSLKHAHVNMVANHGTSSPQSKALAEALEINERYRRDLIRIRPASAYLRNSLPATNLQEDDGSKYPNMLTRAIKQINPKDNNEDIRLRAELDKQYWSNVNRIRVSGAGNTMQVLVKDDIGNWYVKGLSSDTTELVESLRNITSFAIRRNLPTPKTPGQGSGSQSDDNQLSSDFKKYQEHFRNRYVAAIRTEVNKFKTKPDDSGSALSCTLNLDSDPIKLANGKDDTPTLKDYHEDILCRLKAYLQAPAASTPAAQAGSSAGGSTSKQKVINSITALQNARDAYEQELKFLSDLAGFKID